MSNPFVRKSSEKLKKKLKGKIKSYNRKTLDVGNPNPEPNKQLINKPSNKGGSMKVKKNYAYPPYKKKPVI